MNKDLIFTKEDNTEVFKYIHDETFYWYIDSYNEKWELFPSQIIECMINAGYTQSLNRHS